MVITKAFDKTCHFGLLTKAQMTKDLLERSSGILEENFSSWCYINSKQYIYLKNHAKWIGKWKLNYILFTMILQVQKWVQDMTGIQCINEVKYHIRLQINWEAICSTSKAQIHLSSYKTSLTDVQKWKIISTTIPYMEWRSQDKPFIFIFIIYLIFLFKQWVLRCLQHTMS